MKKNRTNEKSFRLLFPTVGLAEGFRSWASNINGGDILVDVVIDGPHENKVLVIVNHADENGFRSLLAGNAFQRFQAVIV